MAVSDIPFAILIILAAVASKVLGCGAGARLAGFTRQEALRIGIGDDQPDLAPADHAALGLQTGLLTARGFAVMVIMVLATTVMTPPLLRAVFPVTPRSEEAAVEAAFADPKAER